MPISTSLPIRRFSQEDFGKVAYEVVGHAFEVHGELGKKFQESVYQATLQLILGVRSISEFAITIAHGSFVKNLYVDLLEVEHQFVNCHESREQRQQFGVDRHG